MKTSIFKLFFTAFSIVFLFSSCLSDGDNSFEVNKDFAYITTYEGRQYAATRNGLITSPAIEMLELNECYFIGYKISSSGASNGIYTATDIASPTLLPQFRSMDVPSIPAISNEFYPVVFSPLPYWDPGEYFSNRWPFIYQAELKQYDQPYAYFYFDRNNQKEVLNGEDKPLKANQIIIDVRFGKQPAVDGTASKLSKEISANLTRVREAYESLNRIEYEDGKTSVIVAIKFRYLKNVDKAEPEETLIGSWDINSGSQVYGFVYNKN